MTNDNLMFTGDTPLMSGHWHNYKTGDSFTVADSFFQDNQYLIKTTDGRMLDASRIGDYIQTPTAIPKEMMESQQESIPEAVSQLLAEPTAIQSQHPLNSEQSYYANTQFNIQPAPDINLEIIRKALASKSIPKVKCDISWKNFPKNEINTICELMDIKIDSIIDWYLANISMNDLYEEYKINLKKFILNEISKKPNKK